MFTSLTSQPTTFSRKDKYWMSMCLAHLLWRLLRESNSFLAVLISICPTGLRLTDLSQKFSKERSFLGIRTHHACLSLWPLTTSPTFFGWLRPPPSWNYIQWCNALYYICYPSQHPRISYNCTTSLPQTSRMPVPHHSSQRDSLRWSCTPLYIRSIYISISCSVKPSAAPKPVKLWDI